MSNTTISLAPLRHSRRMTATESRPTTARHDPHATTLRSEKITDEHLQRLAIVYVRQSTQQQVLEHRESTARQAVPRRMQSEPIPFGACSLWPENDSRSTC